MFGLLLVFAVDLCLVTFLLGFVRVLFGVSLVVYLVDLFALLRILCWFVVCWLFACLVLVLCCSFDFVCLCLIVEVLNFVDEMFTCVWFLFGLFVLFCNLCCYLFKCLFCLDCYWC